MTIFADGTSADTLVIYPKKYLPKELSAENLARERGFAYCGQESGWITASTFDEYCTKIVIPRFEDERKRKGSSQRGLIVLDGHSSRANAELLKKLKNAYIDVVTFVSHTSHICQPLDVLVFGIFKAALRRNTISLPTAASQAERREILVEAAKKALYWSLYCNNVTKSFRRSGVYPLNRERALQHPGVRMITDPEEGWQSPNTKIHGKKRKAIDINCKILTSDYFISLIEEQNNKVEQSPSKVSKTREGQSPSKSLQPQ